LIVEHVKQLGELLRNAGFTGERHASLRSMPGGLPPANVLANLDRPDDARLATLLMLFDSDRTVARVTVEDAVDPLTINDLVEAGLLETRASAVRARVKLSVVDGLIVAGDPISQDGREAHYVLDLTPASVHVAGLTIRREGGAALDLGTGSGIQALFAARHADHVIGVDINPRALYFAALSQHLNHLENVTWLRGDWFEPVRGRRFDLVVACPPVVVSPDHTMLYRDSPVGGEELSGQLLREISAHLTDGGFATVFCNWTHGRDSWEERPREWIAGLDCDALLLNLGSQDPLGYAMNTLVGLLGADRAALADTVKRWSRYYTRLDVEQIASGVVILRRRSTGSNWVQGFHIAGAPRGVGGDQLEWMFAGGDFLASHAGGRQLRELLSSRWCLVDGHRLDQTLVYESGGYASVQALLRQEPGIGLFAHVDARALPVLLGCDGQRGLAQILGETPIPEGLDQAEFHTLCLSTVKELIARGFLFRQTSPAEGARLPRVTASSARN
jgi:SAM-dependent methyltransferase